MLSQFFKISIFCGLFLGPVLSQALTFEECQRLLKKDSSLTPFSANHSDAVFSRGDLRSLKQLFNKYNTAPFSSSRGEGSEPLYSANPFIATAIVNSEGVPVTKTQMWAYEMTDEDSQELQRLLLVYFKKVISQSQSHPLLSNILTPGKNLRVSLHAIRYVLRPGMITNNLGLHRDKNVQLQSVVVLARPKDLEGGHTIMAWPKSPFRKIPYGYAPTPIRAQTWEPQIASNRLLVFDGTLPFHGTTAFDMTRASNPGYRDVLALSISVDP